VLSSWTALFLEELRRWWLTLLHDIDDSFHIVVVVAMVLVTADNLEYSFLLLVIIDAGNEEELCAPIRRYGVQLFIFVDECHLGPFCNHELVWMVLEPLDYDGSLTACDLAG